jgi:hypothetical protein
MLRTYTPIQDPIFTLHTMLEHLVCEVWCNASNDNTCRDLLSADFEAIYDEYDWLSLKVNDIYEKCKPLLDNQRADIREAFYVNNNIEDLCNGIRTPIELDALPSIVETDMKPLLAKFYNYLIDLAKVPGNKLDYYNSLMEENGYKTCPCCGLAKIESAESHYVEDNDHFFPKAHYPFAAVNINNLVPICDKCNKKHKGEKKPLDNNGTVYYPFCTNHQPINVTVEIVDSNTLNYQEIVKEDIQLSFSGDTNKNSTWNWLFNIEKRYNEEICEFSFTELRTIKNRLLLNKDRNNGNTYEDVLNFEINVYDADRYIDRKFLKASFLRAILQKPEWMGVYQ